MTNKISNLYKIVDKLEQRIAALEKTTPKKEESNQLEFPFPELRANVQNNNFNSSIVQLCNGVLGRCVNGTSRRINWNTIINYWLCVYVKDNVPY